ncbi:MAG: hypothetical protein WAX07_00200 [Candidatus Altiarchaeia archaeon]
MDKNVIIRLFYAPGCSGGCCGCGPDPNYGKFEELAEKLVEKFGEKRLTFEAYKSVDVKKFAFLRDPKIKTPVVSVGEKVVSSGEMPTFTAIEAEAEKALK